MKSTTRFQTQDEGITFHFALNIFGKEWIYLRCLDVDKQ